MFLLLKLFIQVLIVGLFLYSKLLPHKDKLNAQYSSIFNFFNSLFTPLLNGLKTVFSPYQVGTGLMVDMTQVVLLIILLIVNLIIR